MYHKVFYLSAKPEKKYVLDTSGTMLDKDTIQFPCRSLSDGFSQYHMIGLMTNIESVC